MPSFFHAPSKADPNLEQSLVEEEWDAVTVMLDVEEFEENEADFQQQFVSYRLSCVDHSIMYTLRKGFDGAKELSSLKAKVWELIIRTIRGSIFLTEQLFEQTSLTLIASQD